VNLGQGECIKRLLRIRTTDITNEVNTMEAEEKQTMDSPGLGMPL